MDGSGGKCYGRQTQKEVEEDITDCHSNGYSIHRLLSDCDRFFPASIASTADCSGCAACFTTADYCGSSCVASAFFAAAASTHCGSARESANGASRGSSTAFDARAGDSSHGINGPGGCRRISLRSPQR